ncbi:hypothetical protein BRC95_08555 [Halobacteriales archaeon QS_5_68_33]|nr:MAG: hypothetical protein BRC95_08555 [Halobacteriales archaeon QS_5_68_33]
MSLKCSILGHRFDETAVERDRQEDGSEVVITITELETCTRCGETRVVSENKEVRTLETPEDAGSEVAGGDAAGAKTATGTDTTDESLGEAESADAVADEAGVEDPTDPAADDGEILGAGGDDGDASDDGGVADDAGAGKGEPDEDEDEDEEVTDDAVIIDGDTGTERDPGEWPDDAESDATAAGAGTASAGSADAGEEDWPPASSDEGDAAGASGDAADEWPEETRRDTDDAAESPLEENASPTVTVPEGMYKCPECGFTDEVESSSLRAGDFCPECRQGTLVQDEDSSN